MPHRCVGTIYDILAERRGREIESGEAGRGRGVTRVKFEQIEERLGVGNLGGQRKNPELRARSYQGTAKACGGIGAELGLRTRFHEL